MTMQEIRLSGQPGKVYCERCETWNPVDGIHTCTPSDRVRLAELVEAIREYETAFAEFAAPEDGELFEDINRKWHRAVNARLALFAKVKP